ncbi:ABC transporter permease [Lysobacter sp. A6]|uniref:ABC transporter permease n=1 Tax=Noviluteimonas lactosilytica TaxID=2888523 RepID=A0ABS8JG88_9GAMM|nr:ABC transporter permease [Lysobacter lactosilyticus]MCC8362606.1 ABC transporter permease [Lysobacter lactosilyticus]
MELFDHIRASVREPGFWAYSSWLDIVTKYRRSRLGMVWLLLPPMLYVGGIGYFYALLQNKDPMASIPVFAIGYLLYRLFASVITESCTVLLGHSGFILDGHLRLTDFMFRVLAKSLFYLLAAMPLVVVVLLLSPALHWTGLLTLPAAFFLVVSNLFWISVVVALLGARYPDVNELTGSIFIFAFILTPILWPPEMAPWGTPHGWFMRANPLYHMIEIIRAPLFGNHIETLTYVYMAAMTVIGWTAAAVLYRRYSRYVPVWV